jgi:hypothetical protein
MTKAHCFPNAAAQRCCFIDIIITGLKKGRGFTDAQKFGPDLSLAVSRQISRSP